MNYKECVNNLKNIIYLEVKKFNESKEKRDTLIYETQILEEILTNMCDDNLQYDLEKIKENKFLILMSLPLIYGDVVSDSFNMVIYNGLNAKEGNKIKINSLINHLLQDYNIKKEEIKILNIEIKNLTPLIIEYKRILSNYKYIGKITNEQIDLIEQLMIKNNFTSGEQIKIFESIRINNIKNKSNDSKISYTVINMLDSDYKKYEIDVSKIYKNKSQFLKIVNSFYEGIKNYDQIEEVLELMPNLEDNTYGYDEFVFIFESLINMLIDDLLESKMSISDPSIYKDYELRQVVIQEYNENVRKYRKLKYEYQLRKNQYLSKLNKQEPEEEKNILFYQSLPGNIEMSYLERDLKKFPEEYLIKIQDLLEKKKYDKLQPDEIKKFTSTNNNLGGYEELRDDQVRIICKHLENNCYCVIGAFVKKDDNPLFGFSLVSKRGCTMDISTPELFKQNFDISKETETRIYEIIEKNARKGIR